MYIYPLNIVYILKLVTLKIMSQYKDLGLVPIICMLLKDFWMSYLMEDLD